MATQITIKHANMKGGGVMLQIKSSYDPTLVKRLKAMGGSWSWADRAWYVSTELEQEVRDLCLEIYGVDPLGEPPEMVTIRYDISGEGFSQEYRAFGRQILVRMHRDSPVKPGEGVSILGPGFHSYGGSRRNPSIGEAEAGTILVIRDVPRSLAEAFAQDDPAVTIEEPETPTTATPLQGFDTEVLIRELERRAAQDPDLAVRLGGIFGEPDESLLEPVQEFE